MEEKVKELISAAKALLDYQKDNSIYDESASDGDGCTDEWMSSELEGLFERLGEAINKIENA